HVVVEVLEDVEEEHGVGPTRLHDEVPWEPARPDVEAGGTRRRRKIRMRLHADRHAELGERGQHVAGTAPELEETKPAGREHAPQRREQHRQTPPEPPVARSSSTGVATYAGSMPLTR